MKLYQKRLADMRRNLKDISKTLRKTGGGERKDLDETLWMKEISESLRKNKMAASA